MAVIGRRPPKSLTTRDIARTYAREDADGNLLRVVVYREPTSGACVQVTSPLPSITATTRSKHHGSHEPR